jgi:hypothetical protein
MKISRHGAAADHGESSIELKSPTFKWRKSDSCMRISQSSVKDFSTKSRHSYDISLSFVELNILFNSLSEAALLEPAVFEKGLESSLKSLIQIKSVIAGLKT